MRSKGLATFVVLAALVIGALPSHAQALQAQDTQTSSSQQHDAAQTQSTPSPEADSNKDAGGASSSGPDVAPDAQLTSPNADTQPTATVSSDAGQAAKARVSGGASVDAQATSNTTGQPERDEGDGAGVIMVVLLIAALLGLYYTPTIIAFARGHGYRFVIFAINTVAGLTVVGWLVCIVWAVWPREKALIDPVVGNVTGTGTRNSGDALGAAAYGRVRGYASESRAQGDPNDAALDHLAKLAQLHAAGALTDAEFAAEKTRILSGMQRQS